MVNALAGACATLTRFFLQQRVEAAVTVPALLGPALFVLGLGGGLAGLLAVRLDRLASLRSLSLTSWRASSSSPAASPEAISTGRNVPRALRRRLHKRDQKEPGSILPPGSCSMRKQSAGYRPSFARSSAPLSS